MLNTVLQRKSPPPTPAPVVLSDKVQEFFDLYHEFEKAIAAHNKVPGAELKGRCMRLEIKVDRMWDGMTPDQRMDFTKKMVEVGELPESVIDLAKDFNGTITRIKHKEEV